MIKFIMLKLEKSNCIFRQSKISNSTLPFEVLKLAENRIPPWRDPKFNLITTVLKLAENRIPWKDPKFNLHFSCQFDHSRRSRYNCGSHYGKIRNWNLSPTSIEKFCFSTLNLLGDKGWCHVSCFRVKFNIEY